MTFANIARIADGIARYVSPIGNGYSEPDTPITEGSVSTQASSRARSGPAVLLSLAESSHFIPRLPVPEPPPPLISPYVDSQFTPGVAGQFATDSTTNFLHTQKTDTREASQINPQLSSGNSFQISSGEFAALQKSQESIPHTLTSSPQPASNGSGPKSLLELGTFLKSLPNLATPPKNAHSAERVLPSAPQTRPPPQPNSSSVSLNLGVSGPRPSLEGSVKNQAEQLTVPGNPIPTKCAPPIDNSPPSFAPRTYESYRHRDRDQEPLHRRTGNGELPALEIQESRAWRASHERRPPVVRQDRYNSYRPGKDHATPTSPYDSYRPEKISAVLPQRREDGREQERKEAEKDSRNYEQNQTGKGHSQSRWDITEGKMRSNKVAAEAFLGSQTPPPKGPSSDGANIPAVVTPLCLSQSPETKIALECTLKITARQEAVSLSKISLQTLLRALKLPNLIQIEMRPGLLYLRLADKNSAHRIATCYRNFRPGSLSAAEAKALEAVKIYLPSDHAPPVGAEVLAAYRAGARRVVVARTRGIWEVQRIMEAARKLWGVLEVSVDEGVVIGFEGVEGAVAGKKILANMFGNIVWEFMDEK